MVDRKEAIIKINNIYNLTRKNHINLVMDVNISELVALFMEVAELTHTDDQIDKTSQKKLSYIYQNRCFGLIRKGYDFDSIFFRICESCYNEGLSKIPLIEPIKEVLILMTKMDFYIQQRRIAEPLYMYDNTVEIDDFMNKISINNHEFSKYRELKGLIDEFTIELLYKPNELKKRKR